MAQHGFVVLAYGESPWLSSCLASLAAQTRATPIMVATSTLTAQTAAQAARFGASLAVNPVSRAGIAGDWNFARAQAPWPYVTLAHQDDVYLPDFAARSVAALERHSDAVLAFTGHDEIADDGERRGGRVIAVKHLMTRLAAGARPRRLGAWRRAGLLAFGNPVGCSAVTFARDRLGAFAFDASFASNLDWAAWWQLHRDGRAFAYVPERLVLRRYNSHSATSHLLADGRRATEDARMFAAIWPGPMARLLTALYRAGYR